MQGGAVSTWPEAPDSIGFDWRGGDAIRVTDAFRSAAHVTRQQVRASRVVVNAMEVRSAIGDVDEDGRLTLTIGHQQPFALRDVLARAIFRVDPANIRILVSDTGGSFADQLEVATADLALEDDAFMVAGTDQRRSWGQIAAAAWATSGLRSAGEFQPEGVTFPTGCHACKIEIDPEKRAAANVRFPAISGSIAAGPLSARRAGCASTRSQWVSLHQRWPDAFAAGAARC